MRRLLVLGVAFGLGCASKAPPPPPASPGVAGPPPLAQAIVRSVRAYLPEEEGDRPAPKDAADFARAVYAENDVELPATVSEQTLAGVRVQPAELRAGDLVFFCGERVSRIAEHVGVYMGKGLFAHFRQGYGVTLERLDGPYYKPRLITARRLIL